MAWATSGGKRMSELDALHQERADQHPTLTRCACGNWQHTGTAVDGREAFTAHLLADHARAPQKRPRDRRGFRKRQEDAA